MAANELSVDLVFKAKNAQQAARQGANDVNATFASQVRGFSPTSIEQEANAAAVAARKAAAAKRAENKRTELAYEVDAASRRNRAAALLRQREQNNVANEVEQASRRNRAAALWRQRAQSKEDVAKDIKADETKKALKAIGLIAAAAAISFVTLKKVIAEVADAANRAAQTYAKILQSGGMAAGFVVRREQLARIIGVSEDQVMQYGAAIAYLNARLDWSTKIFTQTNPTLTALSWNMRILENDFAAMAAKITNAVAPALNNFIDLMDGIIRHSGNAVASIASDAVTNQQKIDRAFQFMDKVNGKGNSLYPNLNSKTGEISFASSSGNLSNKAQEELQKQFQAFLKGHPLTSAAPQAPVSLNRFPASDWQKMGLVIGGGGRSPQEKTAQNTSKMVTHLQQIVNLLQPRTGNIKNPANVLANPMYPQP